MAVQASHSKMSLLVVFYFIYVFTYFFCGYVCAAGVSVSACTVPPAVQQRSRSVGRCLLGSVLPLRRTQREDPGRDRLWGLQAARRTAHVSLDCILISLSFNILQFYVMGRDVVLLFLIFPGTLILKWRLRH